MIGYPTTSVTVTHLPTGVAVTIASNGGRYESVPGLIARAKRVLAVVFKEDVAKIRLRLGCWHCRTTARNPIGRSSR